MCAPVAQLRRRHHGQGAFGSSLKGIPPTVPSSRPASPLLGRESNPAPQKQKLNRASDPRLVGAAGDPGRSFPCPSTLTLNAWHDSGRQFPATARVKGSLADQRARHWDEFAVALHTLRCQGLGHGDPRVITLDGFEPTHAALRRMGMNNESNYRSRRRRPDPHLPAP
jgi:hypothetical protein